MFCMFFVSYMIVIHSAGVGGVHGQQHVQLEEAENNEQLFFVGNTHINH